MSAENKSIQLKKGGTEVVIGVPGNVCFEIESGRKNAFLLLYDKREFDELKAAMSAPSERKELSGDAE